MKSLHLRPTLREGKPHKYELVMKLERGESPMMFFYVRPLKEQFILMRWKCEYLGLTGRNADEPFDTAGSLEEANAAMYAAAREMGQRMARKEGVEFIDDLVS